MSYSVRACTNAKYRRTNTILLFASMALSVVGIVLMIYSLVHSSWLFAASYFIALILMITYIMIRISTVYKTYLATDRRNIYMKTWSNNFLPYDAGNKIKVLSEFIPAGTKIIEIPITDIELVMIGTKNFIKRNVVDDEKFLDDIAPYEISRDYYKKRTMSRMDIIYVRLIDGDSYYMPIMNFSVKNVTKILTAIQRANSEVEIRIGSRDYRRFAAKQQQTV